MTQKDALCIDEAVKVNPFSKLQQSGGQIEVVSSSKIVISGNGGINASERGLAMNTKHRNETILKFGGYTGSINGGDDVESASNVDGSGGGVICLLAGDGVANRGILSSKGTANGQFSGQTVYIITDELFENRGDIDVEQGGQIIIRCDRFRNEGEITLTPNVMIGRSFLLGESIRTLKGKK